LKHAFPATAAAFTGASIGPFHDVQLAYYWTQTSGGVNGTGKQVFSLNSGQADVSEDNDVYYYALPMVPKQNGPIGGVAPACPEGSRLALYTQGPAANQAVYDCDTGISWLGGHYYSTPYQLVGKEVDVRSTSGTVEIFCQGKRVASHMRSSKPHVASTDAAHRPKSHQQYLEWTPTRIIAWAGKVGPSTARLVEKILISKPHPEMGYRSALGVIRLERKYGAERLEAACTRAVRLNLDRFQSVKSMLENGLDRQPLPQLLLMPSPVTHENLRGPGYYAAQPTRREVGQC
jgi:hypothetical protein